MNQFTVFKDLLPYTCIDFCHTSSARSLNSPIVPLYRLMLHLFYTYQSTDFLFYSINLVFNTVNITWFLIIHVQYTVYIQISILVTSLGFYNMSCFQYHFHDFISDFLFYSFMSFRAEWNYQGDSRAKYARSSDMDS